jgi:hypothetical protein
VRKRQQQKKKPQQSPLNSGLPRKSLSSPGRIAMTTMTTTLPLRRRPPVVSDDHSSELADTAAKEGLSQEEARKLFHMCFFRSLLLFLFFASPEKLVF